MINRTSTAGLSRSGLKWAIAREPSMEKTKAVAVAGPITCQSN